ncbi:hypothetical protein Tco_0562178 [Tanacetum coccineum]
MAEKFNREKEKSEKLKELKARLNFEGCSRTSRYSESKTVNTKEHEKRNISRRSRSPRTSVFSRIRRERSRSPRLRVKEGGVFKRLGSRGKNVSAHLDSYNQRAYTRRTETLSESKDSEGGHWKSRSKMKKSSGEEDDFILEELPSAEEIHQRSYRASQHQTTDRESTEDFVRRYKLESRDVKGAPECIRIFGFVHGITNPKLIKCLHDKIPKTLDEMIRVTTSFLRGEVAASNHERKKRFHHGNSMTAIKSKISKKEVSKTSKGRKGSKIGFSYLQKLPKRFSLWKNENLKLCHQ